MRRARAGSLPAHPAISACPRRWLALALLAFPMLASAEEKLTYECTGYLSVESAGAESMRPITSYYTLVFSGSAGRYFDWDEHQWQPIHLITDKLFQLYSGKAGPVPSSTGAATIDRQSGHWRVSYNGGEASMSIGGRCEQVPLREPPPETQAH